MRRFLTLVCLLSLAIPAGIAISGCTRNPGANYCNGLGYGAKITDVNSITLPPQTTGLSLAFGQTQQLFNPSAKTCKGDAATVSSYTYGTSNNQLVDVSPSGVLCAGTWNRNTGGGIANYTDCTAPNPLPSTGGLPYATAYVTAAAQAVTSNPVAVYVHAPITSVTLVTQPVSGAVQQCYSQGQLAQLNAQACFTDNTNTQRVLCAPSAITGATNPAWACPAGPPNGILASLIPDCSTAIGTLSYQVGNGNVGSINSITNQITAAQPGTTAITASLTGTSSSAGYFSTCPPQSINVTLANGSKTGSITQGVTQDLTTTILDTLGHPITGLSLDYQSTDPMDISASGTGNITTNFPGKASVYAICQPPSCNNAPIDQIGVYGTGLPISSNPVTITTPGTASDYVWFGAPGESQYIVPIELLSGTAASTVRLPYVPNSMVMDRDGNDIYFGSAHELMVVSTTNNSITRQDTSVPGLVLAVAPNNGTILINDQARQIFTLYSMSGGIASNFAGLGNAAAWTPDSKTLFITDNAELGGSHTDTLYVYNANTGWSSTSLPPSPLPPAALAASAQPPNVALTETSQTPAIVVPSVGAYLRGWPTVAHTWCPSGTVGDTASMLFYPQGPAPDNSVNVQTDVLAATTDGNHILGATIAGGGITLSDIGVSIPALNCLPPQNSPNYPLAFGDTLSPLVLTNTPTQAQIQADAAAVNQVVASPTSTLAFVTYTPPATGAQTGVSLPYYVPSTGGAAGTLGSVPFGGSAAASITAPVAGAFSPDNSLFFVSTAGDNLIHYISVPEVLTNPAQADTQQLAPNLPACSPTDVGCALTTAPSANQVVPATVIVVKPRST